MDKPVVYLDPQIPSDRFEVHDIGEEWLIKCKKCGDQWEHPKKEISIGTRLHLLNHAAGHEKKKTKK